MDRVTNKHASRYGTAFLLCLQTGMYITVLKNDVSDFLKSGTKHIECEKNTPLVRILLFLHFRVS